MRGNTPSQGGACRDYVHNWNAPRFPTFDKLSGSSPRRAQKGNYAKVAGLFVPKPTRITTPREGTITRSSFIDGLDGG
jgi:hypothetical protein